MTLQLTQVSRPNQSNAAPVVSPRHPRGGVRRDTAMLMFDKAVGLIRQVTDEGPLWLVRFNPATECSEFIESERLEQESYRDSLYREIDWRLGLDRKRDYLLSSVPRLHLEISPCGRVHPPHTFHPAANNYGRLELYAAEVYREATLDAIAADPLNCWTRPVEIYAGVDGVGRALRLDQFQWIEQSEPFAKSV
ncbi:MAG: hypothetical protein R3B96_14910 [Pirellulaceae bacterium]|nr:hypothetical protein [Planctomycetales bacterium]